MLSARRTTRTQFKRIKRAYEVLSNEELRNVYDRHGEEGAQTYEMILHQQRMGEAFSFSA